MKPDIIVYSKDERPKLVVEVKKKKGASPEWAAKLRRNLLAHSRIVAAPYFLLASSDRFFLWKDAATEIEKQPDYEIDAKRLLEGYVHRTGEGLEDLSGYSLEMVIASWLSVLSSEIREEEKGDREELSWFYESGLSDAIKGGQILTN